MNMKDKKGKINLKKIINYEISKKDKTSLQQKAIKALGVFLVVMMLCTMLSRFANKLTIPVVSVSGLKPSTINDEKSAEGKIVKNKENKVKVEEGLKINNINVNVGSNIKVGDVLAELDLEDIKEKVDELNKNIQTEQKQISRAQEDYNKGVNEKQEAVNKALKEQNEAKKKLDEQIGKEEKNPMMEETLKNEYEMKKSVYEDAVKASKDVTDLSRVVQDAKDNAKVDEYSKRLEKIKPYLDSEGKVISQVEGVVTSIFGENGGTTTDAILSIADKDEGFKFVATIERRKSEEIAQGQEVKLRLSGDSSEVDNLKIEAIAANKENSDMIDLMVNLPVNTGNIDESGTLVLADNSKKHDTTVPVSAIYQDDKGYYVLTISEEKTILGEELIARKSMIEIVQKDGQVAAVEGLSRDFRIIVDSNKKVNDGDKVRMEEQ